MVRTRKHLPERWAPALPPSGTANFGNLLRDPFLALSEIVARELAARGFEDLRPALLAVGQHVRAEGSRITELAEHTQLTKATVVRTVDELARLGYCVRVPDPADGRAKLVIPTERALAVEALGRETIAATRDAWAQALEPGEFDQLEALLLRLRAVLWPDDEAGDGS